ncbi:hypothetical protein P153DRAFT_360054 [Dothidotthia symphoricarpi CBS 119687]|uniref:Uncharacterized protein n=1 Tax=Dothidotthia symphoricarpi CBS 119687 TaxID=1392245 RepID=A0A6A6A479_9PLEO|nr:uncharacterized protein P153DRAFT_360054 [Dothidotthia symphoricarpi CBS 119687]KAF2125717.1 hypothetical protein P153DRAFT_360054 [Dothidotthia symphoricarpi CBS 119687]
MSTHFRPRTVASLSPVRPPTSYSTRSTVRAVTPSPDSLKETLKRGFADQGTPAPESDTPPPPMSENGDSAARNDQELFAIYVEHAENDNFPTYPTSPSLQRGGVKLGRTSPQKSRSRSPRKRPSSTPSHLPSHRDSSALEELSCPDTPSPVTREQQRLAYAPLQISTTAQNEMKRTEPLRKTRSKPLLSKTHMETRHHAPQPCKPITINSLEQHMSVSRQSNITHVSVASKRTVFLTLGRDEMERKKALVETDEGPFARAVDMQDLEERRVRVGEGQDLYKKKSRKGCGGGCSIM